MRLIVYSHDSFGLGNIRRMLSICEYLIENVTDMSILILSGSPVLHSFRMHPGLDYIKLPCLGRDRVGKMATKYLSTEVDETVRLRSNLIKTAIADFKPDLVLVDKKPYGLLGELKPALDYAKVFLPETKLVLLLRDILDSPEVTIKDWQNNGYYQALDSLYDRILIVGMPEIFDLVQEYEFPARLAQKVGYCGYIRRKPGCRQPHLVRQELQIRPGEKLVLVTPGGGGDGYSLVNNYLAGLTYLPDRHNIKSLIVCGPEMPLSQRQELEQSAQKHPEIQTMEFSDDLASYMEAADLVVSMGGYNTVCEILSYSKRAVVVPRNKPVEEQLIRAEKMAKFGLFKTVHPDYITPKSLIGTVVLELNSENNHLPAVSHLNLDALMFIEQEIFKLLYNDIQSFSICSQGESVQEEYLAGVNN
ncbi:MAG: glycosyltransferase [Xenococcaceae cyanobacterium MO_188.B29]|nr:glycosyltransferase [Xenococcaceae cyanobacterium MO_188.B29]